MRGNKSKIVIWLGISMILVTGLIHAIEAPDAFGDAAYKGWLFCLNAFGAAISGLGIYLHKKTWGWNLGFLIALLSIIFYVISRTIGLPYIPAEPENWLEPLGVVSLLAESIFIAAYMKKE